MRSIHTYAIAGLISLSAIHADAQSTAPVARWEFLASSGALVPTGAQRNAVKDAALSIAQLSYVTPRKIAITGSAGWARSRDLATANRQRLSVFTYDIGAEWRGTTWRPESRLGAMPFAGMGVGGRSYDHRGIKADASHGVAGYAAGGVELGAQRLRLRFEARDYMSGFRPVGSAKNSELRNDLMLLAGLQLSRRAGSR